MKFLKQMPRTTLTVMVICCAVCLVVNLFPFSGNLTEKAILFGAYYKALIIAGEYWRIVTAGLVHVSVWHLLMNMYSMMYIGVVLERILGWKNYLMTLVISVVIGNLFLFVLSGNTVAVGISGGLYGLMACEIYILYRRGILKNQAVQRAIMQTVLMNMLINFMPTVAWQAHLGGAIGGLLCASIITAANRTQKITGYTALPILCVILAVMCMQKTTIRPSETYAGTDAKILKYEYDHGLPKHAVNIARNLDELYDIDYLEAYLKQEN
ncbi:MAG: rhomboid family intramembrane serine protease [Erysipelotrichaceae bacterium]|nr:rhomboid family intramembrane serine protease [Erysipelotrichaceae bacterium]